MTWFTFILAPSNFNSCPSLLTSVRGSRWHPERYFTWYHPIYCGQCPDWNTKYPKQYFTLSYCQRMKSVDSPLLSTREDSPTNNCTSAMFLFTIMLNLSTHIYDNNCTAVLHLFLSLCLCSSNDNELWSNLPILDSILTSLTCLITTVVSASLHHHSLSLHDTLVLKSMHVLYWASWLYRASKKAFKVSNSVNETLNKLWFWL